MPQAAILAGSQQLVVGSQLTIHDAPGQETGAIEWEDFMPHVATPTKRAYGNW